MQLTMTIDIFASV